MDVVFVMPGREEDARRALDVWNDAGVPLQAGIWSAQGTDGRDARVAVVWNHAFGCLSELPKLRGVLSFGAGVDHLLTDPELPRGLHIGRTVDAHLAQDLAQYVELAVLAWRRDWRRYYETQLECCWRPERYRREGTIVVLGLGVLGSAVALRLQAANLGPVVGWSRSGRELLGVEVVTGSRGLREAVGRAHEMVCCLPLTAATTGILDRRLFTAMRPGSYLVNVGRGRHLVEADLVAALDNGQLAGACLDVFAEEPLPPDHRFWSDHRITVTPHVASLTDPESVATLLAEDARRIIDGLAPQHPVDPARGY